MGYYTQLVNCDVRFKKGTKMKEVLQHVKDTMFTDEALLANATGGRFPKSGDIAADTWYAWTNTKVCREATKLATILNEFFEEAELVKVDGLVELRARHDNKQGQEQLLMQTLAPFLTDDSSMEWVGEDHERYMWEFDGTTLVEKYATLVWE